MSRSLLTATLFALSLVCCHPALPPGPIDSALLSCVPPGTVALAGVNLQQVRSSVIYPMLPQSVLAILEPFHDARSLLISYSGKDLLIAARGPFTAPPPGATLLAPGLALTGSPASIQSARAQYKTGATGEPALASEAQSLAAGNQIWLILKGNTTLPLTGNAANLNRLLRNMEFAAVTVRLASTIDFTVIARGRTPEDARHFEETLRATLTMAAVGEARRPDLAALLRAIPVRRENLTVHAGLSTDPGKAQTVLDMLLP